MVKIIGFDLAKKKFQELEDKINNKYNKNDTVDRAYRDASGRNIASTYATREYVRSMTKAIGDVGGTPSGGKTCITITATWSVFSREAIGGQGGRIRATGSTSLSAYIKGSYYDGKSYTVDLDKPLSNSELLAGQYAWRYCYYVDNVDARPGKTNIAVTIYLNDGRSASGTIVK